LKLSRDLCAEAGAIFVMGPSYLHRVIWEYGEDLADKAYLFADPFTRPLSFDNGRYKVFDPSFDTRPTSELLKEFGWIRERVLQIRLALLGDGRRLVPLSEYLELCKTVDRGSHWAESRMRREPDPGRHSKPTQLIGHRRDRVTYPSLGQVLDQNSINQPLSVESQSLAVMSHDGWKGAGMGDKGGKKDKEKNKQQQLTKQKQEEQKKQDKARPKTP
jgi:hypothetical protein